jgi:hypothetical protein
MPPARRTNPTAIERPEGSIRARSSAGRAVATS